MPFFECDWIYKSIRTPQSADLYMNLFFFLFCSQTASPQRLGGLSLNDGAISYFPPRGSCTTRDGNIISIHEAVNNDLNQKL